MGHDITAIRDYDSYQKYWSDIYEKGDNMMNKNDLEIAYLRRGAFGNNSIHTFYEYLECSELDGGVSGLGQYVVIDLKTLKSTVEKIKHSTFDKEDKDEY